MATESTLLPTENSGKSNWSQWVLRLVGLVLFVAIAMKVGKNALFSEISSTRWSFVVVAAALSAGHFCMKAERWHYILGQRRVSVSHFRTIVAYCAGALVGALTPGRIGELSKVVFVRSWQMDSTWGTAFGTIVLDRIADILALLLMATIGAVWFLLPQERSLFDILAALLAFVLGLTASVFVCKRLKSSAVGRKLAEILQRKLGNRAQDFSMALKVGMGRNAYRVFLWTLLAYILFFMHFVLLCRAVGSEISFIVLSWAIAIASLGAILPISISGIGVRDFILVYIFMAWGGTSAQGFAVSLIYLGVSNMVVTAIGIWPFIIGDIDLNAIRKWRTK